MSDAPSAFNRIASALSRVFRGAPRRDTAGMARWVRAGVRLAAGDISDLVCLDTPAGLRPFVVLAVEERDRSVLGADAPASGTRVVLPLDESTWHTACFIMQACPVLWDEQGVFAPPNDAHAISPEWLVPVGAERATVEGPEGELDGFWMRVGKDLPADRARHLDPEAEAGDDLFVQARIEVDPLLAALVTPPPGPVLDTPWDLLRWHREGWTWDRLVDHPLMLYSALLSAAQRHAGEPTSDDLREVNEADYYLTNRGLGGEGGLLRCWEGDLERLAALSELHERFGLRTYAQVVRQTVSRARERGLDADFDGLEARYYAAKLQDGLAEWVRTQPAAIETWRATELPPPAISGCPPSELLALRTWWILVFRSDPWSGVPDPLGLEDASLFLRAPSHILLDPPLDRAAALRAAAAHPCPSPTRFIALMYALTADQAEALHGFDAPLRLSVEGLPGVAAVRALEGSPVHRLEVHGVEPEEVEPLVGCVPGLTVEGFLR